MKFNALSELIDNNKIIPFYRERKNLKEIAPPVSVEFHWTSNCNYDCVHCSYGSRRKTTNYLNRSIVSDLVEDVCGMGVRAVYLSGGGEPTVLKGWHKYAQRLLDNNVKVALITNGVAIDGQHIGVVRQMEYVAVSVYSTQELRYREITQSNRFEAQFLLPNKIKKQGVNTIVGARCVINDVNFDEIFEIYNKSVVSGFDYIIFIPAVDYENSGITLSDDVRQEVKLIIDKNKSLFDFNRTNVAGLLNFDVNHYQKTSYLDQLSRSSDGCKCIQIGSGAFINYDGGVYLCQPDIGNKDLEIGNVGEMSFAKIWGSMRHMDIIENLNERYATGGCKQCRSIAFNKAIDDFEGGRYLDGLAGELDPFV